MSVCMVCSCESSVKTCFKHVHMYPNYKATGFPAIIIQQKHRHHAYLVSVTHAHTITTTSHHPTLPPLPNSTSTPTLYPHTLPPPSTPILHHHHSTHAHTITYVVCQLLGCIPHQACVVTLESCFPRPPPSPASNAFLPSFSSLRPARL